MTKKWNTHKAPISYLNLSKIKRLSILNFFYRIEINNLKIMDIFEIQNQLKEFASERDWEQFHTPKNIAMALSVESSELVEIFQWLKPEESQLPNKKQLELINSEVADIAMYLLRFCDLLDVNLEKAIQEKLVKNAEKYPVTLSKGNAKKYNQRGD